MIAVQFFSPITDFQAIRDSLDALAMLEPDSTEPEVAEEVDSFLTELSSEDSLTRDTMTIPADQGEIPVSGEAPDEGPDSTVDEEIVPT